MTRRLLSVLLLLALVGCGDDDGSGRPPSVSTPPPPVTLPLNGAYDLVVTPEASCGMPGAPYTVRVTVTTFAGSTGNELRGTLPEGGDQLTLDMLYPVAGQLEGALSTRSLTPIDSGGQLFLRNNGRALVTLSEDARAEVAEGVMVGEVRFSPDGASVFPCASTRHSWALFAR
jgi:hypothetical protein